MSELIKYRCSHCREHRLRLIISFNMELKNNNRLFSELVFYILILLSKINSINAHIIKIPQ